MNEVARLYLGLRSAIVAMIHWLEAGRGKHRFTTARSDLRHLTKPLAPFQLKFGLAHCAILALLAVLAQNAAAQPMPSWELVVGVRPGPPFAMRDADGVWTGISVDLWRQMAEQAHLRFRFEEVDTEGLFSGLASGRFDAALSGLAVTPERILTADFLQPYFMAGLGVAVPAETSFDWRPVVNSLVSRRFLLLLLGIVGLILLVAMVAWLLERRHTPYFGGPVRKGLTCSVTWSTQAMGRSSPSSTNSPQTLPGRLLGAGWGAASVGLIAAFTAAVTTAMAARELSGIVRSQADLYHVRVGAVSDSRTNDWLDHQGMRYVTFVTSDAAVRALMAGDLDAVIDSAPKLAWTVVHNHADAVRMLPLNLDPQRYAIALPPRSPLTQPLNIAVLEITQSEWWQQTKKRYLGID